MAAAAAVIGVIGTGFQMQGQIAANDAQSDMLLSQGNAARENARLARLEASENAKVQQIQSDKAISAIAPQYAASGVDLEGSVFDVIANSIQNAERDRLNIIYQGELKARSFESGAASYAHAAGGISNIGVIGTGLSGFGQAIGGLGNYSGGGGSQNGTGSGYTGGNPTTGGYA
jgi:hypothetical protein